LLGNRKEGLGMEISYLAWRKVVAVLIVVMNCRVPLKKCLNCLYQLKEKLVY
jgi:hypothetical protein